LILMTWEASSLMTSESYDFGVWKLKLGSLRGDLKVKIVAT